MNHFWSRKTLERWSDGPQSTRLVRTINQPDNRTFNQPRQQIILSINQKIIQTTRQQVNQPKKINQSNRANKPIDQPKQIIQ